MMTNLHLLTLLFLGSSCSNIDWSMNNTQENQQIEGIGEESGDSELEQLADDSNNDPNQNLETNNLDEQDKENPIDEKGFLVPEYANPLFKASSDYPFDSILKKVIDNQEKGQGLADFLAANGTISTEEGDITLTQINANLCPGYLENCDEMNHEQLGIPKKAVLNGLQTEQLVRNQGERGTCVAFALNAALEILINRGGNQSDLSEQNTYLQAKELTDSWSYAGLAPEFTIEQFVEKQRPFVLESAWQYNPKNMNCDSYLEDHKGATCSSTEAQGGGTMNQDADPRVTNSQSFTITEAHQLFASIGRVKQAIAQDYPVVLSVNANYDFNLVFYKESRKKSIKNGVVSWIFKDDSCGKSTCGHAILAVAYQDDENVEGGGYLIVQNSWGTSWGEQGFAYLTYEWLKYNLLDAQAIVQIKEQ